MINLGAVVAEKLEAFLLEAALYIPFTGSFTVRRGINKQGQSILNLGCGQGRSMRQVNKCHRWGLTVGVDIFAPYLKECKKQMIHNEHVCADIRKLPFRRKSFDIVLCMQVLEHLEKGDGENLIEAMEEIARSQVLISVPVGGFKFHGYDNNPYQEHRSSWTPGELRRRGYLVTGQALRGGVEPFSHLPRIINQLSAII